MEIGGNNMEIGGNNMEIHLMLGDCNKIMEEVNDGIIVIDPPFNIGYHYNSYSDKMNEADYYNMLSKLLRNRKAVVIHYPEQLHKLSIALGQAPERVVSWVYNSNTGKQHRDIAFYNVTPDFKKVVQPYKNPNDKRVKKLLERGKMGAKLYDWWNINQVKNVSKDKTEHPCQMPLEVMTNIIGILPEYETIIDCFMGSGTTGVACKKLGRSFVGIELDEKYFNIAKERIESVGE